MPSGPDAYRGEMMPKLKDSAPFARKPLQVVVGPMAKIAAKHAFLRVQNPGGG
jgi:hypothetical protein